MYSLYTIKPKVKLFVTVQRLWVTIIYSKPHLEKNSPQGNPEICIM